MLEQRPGDVNVPTAMFTPVEYDQVMTPTKQLPKSGEQDTVDPLRPFYVQLANGRTFIERKEAEEVLRAVGAPVFFPASPLLLIEEAHWKWIEEQQRAHAKTVGQREHVIVRDRSPRNFLGSLSLSRLGLRLHRVQ